MDRQLLIKADGFALGSSSGVNWGCRFVVTKGDYNVAKFRLSIKTVEIKDVEITKRAQLLKI
ncbi:hypothetical protein Sjap_017253 [Stephania japonica]|uniref:Uncharacterized protein n=1 Tax=Stephania japonica TaxID=461633 RepID=A0AAP0NJ77_9MAGN